MQTTNRTKNNLSDIDVLILCGGLGSRLAPVLGDRPKPMAEMNHRPFLDILIDYFAEFGFRRFILCTGHNSEVIQDYYSQKDSCLRLVISNEQAPLGTAGAVKNAQRFINSDPFIVANGDSFCSADLGEFYNFHLSKQSLMSMVVTESEDTADCGRVVLNDLQQIVCFEEKKQENRKGYVNAGIYLFQKQVLSFIPEDSGFSLEYDLFPMLTDKGCYAFISSDELIDIGTPLRYERAKQFFGNRDQDRFT